MPIIELQRRLAEIGRIRLGQQIQSKGGKKRPAALDTFRLTSSDRDRIAEAAKLYGGTVTTWESPSGRPQWEVITTSTKLPVVVPPSAMAFSQNYELWSAGGCQRRCDGITERIGEQPCLCDPENRQCDIHTRLSVMLRDLSGLGVWRVDTQGFYAAVELQGAVEVIGLAAGRGQMLPATLRLDHREIKRVDEGVKKFVVPVLDIDVSPAQLLMGTVAVTPQGALPQGPQGPLTPVPESAAEAPRSIADQVAAAENQPSRRRAAPIKGTGIAPRTAAQAREGHSSYSDAPTDEEQAAAQETAEVVQDLPRMVTKGQLTKLGVLLTGRGFRSKTEDGKRVRMEFCMTLIRTLVPDTPWSNRTITSSTQLTFDEAHQLIEWLENEARKPLITDHTYTAAVVEAGREPIDFYCVAGVGGGELCGEPRSRHAEGVPTPEPEPAPRPGDSDWREPGEGDSGNGDDASGLETDEGDPETLAAEDDPNQLNMLADQDTAPEEPRW